MQPQQCTVCGKEFERGFGDTSLSQSCPQCQAHQEQAERKPLLPVGETVTAASFPVTLGLIALNVLVFAVMVLRGVSAFQPTPAEGIAFGADYGPLTLSGQWWRLITSTFVHFGIIHLGFNMWCLWSLGCAAERLLGRFAYLFVYLASGIAGSIAGVYWHPLAAGAGASGAIFGIAGVLVAFVYLKKTPSHLTINSQMMSTLGTFIIFNLIYGAARSGVSNIAHLGGLVMGLVLGALLPSGTDMESTRQSKLATVVAVSAVVMVAGSVATKHFRNGISQLPAIEDLLETGKTDEAINKLKDLTVHEPRLALAQALLADAYVEKKDFPQAATALEKAVHDEPDNVSFQQQLGFLYNDLQRHEEAKTVYQKILARKPSNVEARVGLGYAHVGLKNYDSAIVEFQKAAAKGSHKAAIAVGMTQIQAARYADAQTTFRELLKQHPDDDAVRQGLALAIREGR